MFSLSEHGVVYALQQFSFAHNYKENQIIVIRRHFLHRLHALYIPEPATRNKNVQCMPNIDFAVSTVSSTDPVHM